MLFSRVCADFGRPNSEPPGEPAQGNCFCVARAPAETVAHHICFFQQLPRPFQASTSDGSSFTAEEKRLSLSIVLWQRPMRGPSSKRPEPWPRRRPLERHQRVWKRRNDFRSPHLVLSCDSYSLLPFPACESASPRLPPWAALVALPCCTVGLVWSGNTLPRLLDGSRFF